MNLSHTPSVNKNYNPLFLWKNAKTIKTPLILDVQFVTYAVFFYNLRSTSTQPVRSVGLRIFLSLGPKTLGLLENKEHEIPP